MRELLRRIRDWIQRDRLDAELQEELRFHRERLERDSQATGIAANEAQWTARRRIGNTMRVTEQARERWSLPWLDVAQQDIRYAIRGLRRSPGFALTVIATLGLAIGANAAIFGVIDRLMFRPFPYLEDPGHVDRVYLRIGQWARGNAFTVFPYTRYLDLRKWTTSFSHHAAFVTATHGVGTGEDARERAVLGVSASFFDFFDARPALGRFFLPGEDTIPAGANVAVVSFDYWSNELGGRHVLGEAIQVGNAAYTIIGVAPSHFVGVSEDERPAVFVPITAYAANQGGGSRSDYWLNYNWDWTQMMVRRKPGVTRQAASADLANAMLASWNASRVVHPGYGSAEVMKPRALVGPLKTASGPDPGLEAKTLLWVTAVAAIVLLIACANVANLLLARVMRRRRETALRRALGVSRGRLAAQAFTETLMLSLLGCAAGIVIAQWGGAAMRRLFITEVPAANLSLDWRTVAVSMAAALVAAIATAMAPVLLVGRDDVAETLKAGAREGMYQRSMLRTALLVMQGTLSVVLLVGAGLFVRSLTNVRALPLGYDVDRVLLAEWERRGTPMDSTERAALRARLLETALARPDVERGSWVNSAPFAGGTSILNMSVPGIDSVRKLGRFTYQIASADYFETVGTRLLSGRLFSVADRDGSPPVTVVSEAMAVRLWPAQSPIGRCVKLSWRSTRPDTMPCTTVIGVVENAVHDPVADYPMRYYLPESQLDFGATWLLLRMRSNPATAAEDVRRSLQAVMPGQALVTVRPARELVDAKRRSWLVGATLFVGLGMLALVVAAVGLFGVVSYTVAQRRHELGVRIALGAQSRDIVRLVLEQGIRFAIAGIAIGATLSLLAARWIQPLLFQQSARDPMVFAVVGLVLLVVTLTASALPALRATRADPNTVLRAE